MQFSHFLAVTTRYYDYAGFLSDYFCAQLSLGGFTVKFFLTIDKTTILYLTYCSSVVRALVCQPRSPDLNPGGVVQSQLLQ